MQNTNVDFLRRDYEAHDIHELYQLLRKNYYMKYYRFPDC